MNPSSIGPAVFFVLFFGVIGVVVYAVWKSARDAKRAREQFAELHRLEQLSGLPDRPDWLHKAGILSAARRISDVLRGTVKDTPVVICTAHSSSGGGGGKGGSPSTIAVVPLEGSRFPPCYLLPLQLGTLMSRMLSWIGGSMGVEALEAPALPNHTVIGVRGEGVEDALEDCDLRELANYTPHPLSITDGWLVVHPAWQGRSGQRVLTTLEDFQALLDAALDLKQILEKV